MGFKAIWLTKDGDAGSTELKELDESAFDTYPQAAGTVRVAISHSTLNYKDALAITHRSPVVRSWPMIPGIDGAGVVTSSSDPRWGIGDPVMLNGWGAGELHWGCLSQRMQLPGEWLQPLPAGMSAAQAMGVGTAGYTAMLCVMALQDAGLPPGQGEILVTGASGGVGSYAIALLSSAGYRVVASSGKPEEADYLRSLGASEVIDRQGLNEPGKPLQKERWAGVVDSVGSYTLANALAQTQYGGAVAACGLAQGMELPATVAPFILRGVRLLGIDSVMCPMPRRNAAWRRLASELDQAKLGTIARAIGLGDAIEAAHSLLANRIRGRLLVALPPA
ncbi:MDR family oxidoreductase [Chitinimonas sp.]|uniref:acrylyl-CoA reductase (NADPH) n=1 Tax=Chitinimonas sp. TaxID=1934313 RepID=UPI002F9274F7